MKSKTYHTELKLNCGIGKTYDPKNRFRSTNLTQAVQLFLIAVKNGELTIYPKENNALDYIQILKNAIKEETK